MKAYHNSRDIGYRAPYGAVLTDTAVTLSLDVWDAPDARVTLRTWVEGKGETLHEMTPVPRTGAGAGAPVRFQGSITPNEPGIIWYYFIIELPNGAVLRYGAKGGRYGGVGETCEWEPPSFQISAWPAGATDDIVKEVLDGTNPMMLPPAEMTVRFMRNQTTAPELREALETLRESCPADAFVRVFDLLASFGQHQLFALLAGASASEAADTGRHTNYHEDPHWGGVALGRLWCTCLIQLLATAQPIAWPEDRQSRAGIAMAKTNGFYYDEDADCETIVQNVLDLHRTLPVFEHGRFECFAAGESVFGMWRRGDADAVCVLVNSSLHEAREALVPLAGEEVSDVLDGYPVELVELNTPGSHPYGASDVERYARVRLNPLGSAILYFHPAQRLGLPMEEGLGVLAHVTSIPGSRKGRPGTLGAPARRFVDWLAEAGMRYWQVLPVSPTDECGSPYAGISAFAGNVRLLGASRKDPQETGESAEYRAFCQKEADWLEPYACFMALHQKMGGAPWQEWPKQYRSFAPGMLDGCDELRESAEQWRLAQFTFERQWKELRAYANKRGIKIVGDMPIYVSTDSADVWANPGIFQLGPDGRPSVVAGCPPDAFSVDGQVWGNPVYDWDVLAKDGYRWWMRRMERMFSLYDYVRLDHFIGFCRYFSIPQGQKASKGFYRLGPGLAFFEAMTKEFGPLPILAEDLGSIVPAVRALIAACGFPGMDIIQFVDGNDPLSGYHPRPGKVAYTGTHDNQTIVGYAAARYPELDAHEAGAALAEAVATCCAPVAVFPLQDLMGLGDEARMNTPATVAGNWSWQARQDDMELAQKTARHLIALRETSRN